jgi:outer membrane lipoprotein carrier protein
MILRGKKRWLGCLLVFVVLLSWGKAWSLTPEEVVEGIQRRYKELHDLEADFHQTTTLPMMDQVKEASGRLYLKMPGKMRWDYLEGEKKTVLVTGQTMLFYDPEEYQATITDLSRMPNSQGLLTFITGMGDLQRDFLLDTSVPLDEKHPGQVMIKLLPRAEDSQWTQLSLFADPKNFQVVKTIFEGIQGDRTTIEYTNIRTNVGLSDDLFHFEIPEGTDILHYPLPQGDQ